MAPDDDSLTLVSNHRATVLPGVCGVRTCADVDAAAELRHEVLGDEPPREVGGHEGGVLLRADEAVLDHLPLFTGVQRNSITSDYCTQRLVDRRRPST